MSLKDESKDVGINFDDLIDHDLIANKQKQMKQKINIKKRPLDSDENGQDKKPRITIPTKKRPREEENNDPNKKQKAIEPLLDPANARLTTFPIKFHDIWNMYKLQFAAFWKAEEIDFSGDASDFEKFTPAEQQCIKMILAFFAASDGIVNFNLRERFLTEVQAYEAQVVYAFQMMMENVHGEVYSLMLENIVKDPVEKARLFNAIENVESVKAMADWAFKWIESSDSFAHRIVAFAIVEGIFFSGAFAAIFWLKKYRGQGKHIMNGLVKSNEFIARDEGMHTNFACLLYSHVVNKLSTKEIYDMMDEAIAIAKKFTDDAIQVKMIGMNQESMGQYIEHIADRLIVSLGYPKKYLKTNPFDFMETIGLLNKTNFFESRPTGYQMAHTKDNVARRKIVRLKKF
jgi:ribonucleotide reductase beta subunit family protein with ferritin-like domain